MARVKRGVTSHKRHKRLLQDAEGRKGTKSRLVKPAREALLHALAYATRDRKQRKRQLRQLWIVRINAAARQNGLTYGQFIAGLKKADVEIDRKILADLAVRDAATFGQIAELAKSLLRPRSSARTSASRALDVDDARGLVIPGARCAEGNRGPVGPDPRTRGAARRRPRVRSRRPATSRRSRRSTSTSSARRVA